MHGRRQDFEKGRRFLKNPGFTLSISKIFFFVPDFDGHFQ
jgi:hypothetical protein